MPDETKKLKAIGMISGGLDSTLAVFHMKKLGFEVKALTFYTGFCMAETHRRLGGRPRDGHIPRNEALHAAAILNVDIEFVDISEEYVDVVTNPRFGYGANMNPCIDCRILMMKKAREIMEKEGAEFVFTGEVIGQRPKSQRRETLSLIEKESGLDGRLLRPLCGKRLPPTLAEEKGIIKRDDLLGFSGRGRKEQIAMAEEMGLAEFPQPAGGCCFLTDESYSHRFRDLIEHRKDRKYSKEDIILLAVGRHFRLPNGEKLIVSRTDSENMVLERYKGDFWSLQARDHSGPLALFESMSDNDSVLLASGITARYGRGRDEPRVELLWCRGEESYSIETKPTRDEALIESLRIQGVNK